jgi:hypothetical protein
VGGAPSGRLSGLTEIGDAPNSLDDAEERIGCLDRRPAGKRSTVSPAHPSNRRLSGGAKERILLSAGCSSHAARVSWTRPKRLSSGSKPLIFAAAFTKGEEIASHAGTALLSDIAAALGHTRPARSAAVASGSPPAADLQLKSTG